MTAFEWDWNRVTHPDVATGDAMDVPLMTKSTDAAIITLDVFQRLAELHVDSVGQVIGRHHFVEVPEAHLDNILMVGRHQPVVLPQEHERQEVWVWKIRRRVVCRLQSEGTSRLVLCDIHIERQGLDQIFVCENVRECSEYSAACVIVTNKPVATRVAHSHPGRVLADLASQKWFAILWNS